MTYLEMIETTTKPGMKGKSQLGEYSCALLNANSRSSAATPASSEHADGISPSERRHREAMEYAEEEEPDQVVEEVLEASAQVPNIPVPRSSDGTVRVNCKS